MMETSQVHVIMSRMVVLATLMSTLLIYNMGSGVEGIGVNWGTLGDNLPPPAEVVALLKSKGFTAVRLFEPNAEILTALEGSGLNVVLGTLNQDLEKLANDPSFAAVWVNAHIVPHAKSVHFQYIGAGNEVIPGTLASFVLPAIKNLDAALKAVNIPIPVTAVVHASVLAASNPPSQCAFSAEAATAMAPIAAYLEAQKRPLLANLYTYYAYDPMNVPLDYAMLNSTGVVVRDGRLGYQNLLEAQVDALYSALEKVGAPSVEVVLAETGWPSAGRPGVATLELAETYNNNLVSLVSPRGAGTPKRPGKPIQTFIFALFNENKKPPGVEQNWGLFYPDTKPVYPFNVS
ncbi:hypothetical protein H6P81_020494 [Aristolochia fimbriata]|nr:hypothetical protein H6P81_020494 [Aristolochia fimbriata]